MMFLRGISVFFCILFTVQAFADSNYQRHFDYGRRRSSEQRQPQQREYQSNNNSGPDGTLLELIFRRKRSNFVEASGMKVVELLPDDRDGLTHQRWVVSLSNGQRMLAVYNTDMCPHVPLKLGDVIAMGGELVWNGKQPLLHWLHHDPNHRRPDGYVEVGGQRYCYR